MSVNLSALKSHIQKYLIFLITTLFLASLLAILYNNVRIVFVNQVINRLKFYDNFHQRMIVQTVK